VRNKVRGVKLRVRGVKLRVRGVKLRVRGVKLRVRGVKLRVRGVLRHCAVARRVHHMRAFIECVLYRNCSSLLSLSLSLS
jgi:hypothetical protein